MGRRVAALQLPVPALPQHGHDVRRAAYRAVADPACRPDKSEVIHTAYLRPGLSPEERAKAVDMAPWICETVVDGEDFWVAGRTEPGVRTGLLDTVVFGRNEPAPQHLHRGFAAALATPTTRSARCSPTSARCSACPTPGRTPRSCAMPATRLTCWGTGYGSARPSPAASIGATALERVYDQPARRGRGPRAVRAVAPRRRDCPVSPGSAHCHLTEKDLGSLAPLRWGQ